MERSKEALACYDRALELDPENLGVRCLKGFAFNNLKEFEKSIECYDEVLKFNPDDVFSWYQKGSALESLGNYGEAMECYDKALEIDPTDALIREKKMKLLGLIYKKGTLENSPTAALTELQRSEKESVIRNEMPGKIKRELQDIAKNNCRYHQERIAEYS